MGSGQRYVSVRDELASVCEDAGRSLETVKLIAVSKTVSVDEARRAFDAGALDFGENRPEGLVEKAAALPLARWHFIGNIQSRRLGDIVGTAALIHSLYQVKHAQKIDDIAHGMGVVQDALIEVNVSGEDSKGGLAPREVPSFIEATLGMPNLRLCGLMTMAPQGDLERAREAFEELSYLKEYLLSNMDEGRAESFTELSMGMSEDWREAVYAGSTMVRIGRAVFSENFA